MNGQNEEQKIEVLGIKMDNYFLEKVMEHFEEYLENDFLNTIGVISTSLLSAASEDRELKQQIENLDMTIVGEKEILEAANVLHKRRYKEVENHQFVTTFFKYIQEYNRTIFLLVDREEQIKKLNDYLSEKYKGINVVGAYAVETGTENEDKIINEINGMSPDIIVSVIGTTFQEKFIDNNRQKLNAKVWLGLGHHERARNSIGLKPSWLSKLVDKTLFKRLVSKYNSEMSE
jgi:Teichoic acid biosynthesis proteins